MDVQYAPQKLQLVSRPESINQVEKLVDEIREEYKISEDCYGKILISMTEAVTNAIAHGNKSDPSKMVDITYHFDHDKINFTVTDQGPGFDYYNLPDPTAPENLEKPCGRGIYLMKHLSDQLIFNNNGSSIELTFYTN
jgi:serine/threonine-protein kinase RsbW